MPDAPINLAFERKRRECRHCGSSDTFASPGSRTWNCKDCGEQFEAAPFIEPLDPRIGLVSDLYGKEPEPIEWIVDALIPKKMVTLLAGKAGLGKTYSSQMLMTSCALGKPWLDLDVRRCKTLALFAEDPKERLWDRQIKICEHYGVELIDLDDWAQWIPNDDGNFVLFSCFRHMTGGTPRTIWTQLEKRCADWGVELLILDNLRNVFEGNDTRIHINSFMRWFNARAKVLDAAILILTNPPKDRSSYFSGNQAWEDAARSTLSLSPPKDEKGLDVPGEFVLRVEKNSYIAWNHPMKKHGITLEWQDDVLVRKPGAAEHALGFVDKLTLDNKVLAYFEAAMARGWLCRADPGSRSYVPSVLANQRQWVSAGVTYYDLVASLDRLLADERIVKVSVKGVWFLRPATGPKYLGEPE